MKRALIPLAALPAFAGCDAFMTTEADPNAPALQVFAGPVFEVSAPLGDAGDDRRIHCAAARHAEGTGAAEMNWIAGAQRMENGEPVSAAYRYFAPSAAGAPLPEGEIDKVFGGPEPMDRWLRRCAGVAA